MRTPKIETLHRILKWYKDFDNISINPLGLYLSPIDSNGWLADFTDGDGNFTINITNKKKKGVITTKRVQIFNSFMVISHNFKNHIKVINYFNRFPLYSSKFLA